MKGLFLSLSLISLLSLSVASTQAADADPSTSPAAVSDPTGTPSLAGSASPLSSDAVVAPPAAEESADNPFQKSRLTSDESEAHADRRTLLLTTGEDKSVDLDFDANAGPGGISIGNPQIVTTTLISVGGKRNQIVFKPLKSGETTVTIRDKVGTIKLIFTVRVTGSDLERTAAELKDLLRDIEGIEIRIVGAKVIVEGEVLVPSDYGRLFAVVNDPVYLPTVLNLTTLSPIAMQVLAKRIYDDIHSFAPNVTTRVVNGRIFLEGNVDDNFAADKALKIATLYLPDIRPGNPLDRDTTAQRVTQVKGLVQNFIVVNPAPPKKQEKLVRVTVHFVELSKDYERDFGFVWAPAFTSDPQINLTTAPGSTGAAAGPSFSATLSSLIPKLNSAQNAGFARILKVQTIVVRSGQQATLSEGTTQYLPSTAQNGATSYQATPINTSLGVTPSIVGQSEDVALELNLDQNKVTSESASGVPITADHAVKTKVYIKSNESAAIAGEVDSDIETDFNKDPTTSATSASGSTDTLFNLTRSKSYTKTKSQFVVFVTPQIIENASEGTEDLKRNFRVKVK